jgi:gamma-glutamylcyclotransferase (GGCT)/AIG2-like uncharacterized protein YtfP
MAELLHYLAYGSNLHPQRLRRRTPSAQLAGTTALPGWKLYFNKLSHVDGSGKCHILYTGEPTDGVHAAVYRLSPDDKPGLDSIEGLGHGYKEHTLGIEPFGEVFLYLAEPGAARRPVKPLDWYKQLVVAGARYHRFPDDYISTIEAVESTHDPDSMRRQEHLALIDALAGGQST